MALFVNHVRPAVTTIRPSPFAQTLPQAQVSQGQAGGVRDDSSKLAAQRAFFAAIQAQGVAAPQAPAAPVAAAAPQAPAPVQRMAPTNPAEPPQKIMRPGSLLDIRV